MRDNYWARFGKETRAFKYATASSINCKILKLIIGQGPELVLSISHPQKAFALRFISALYFCDFQMAIVQIMVLCVIFPFPSWSYK
jgi:hypothetical protein